MAALGNAVLAVAPAHLSFSGAENMTPWPGVQIDSGIKIFDPLAGGEEPVTPKRHVLVGGVWVPVQ